jgi:hypothetical protein
MVGNHANFKDDDNTPEKRVERIFNLMDTVSFKVFLLVPAGLGLSELVLGGLDLSLPILSGNILF